MKAIFLLLLPATVLAQSAIDQKIDLSKPSLPPPAGVAIWIGRTGYHDCAVTSATADGSLVTLTTSTGPLQIEWNKLSAEAKGKLGADYQAAVDRANREVEQALQQQQAASEQASGIGTYQAKVLSVTDEGLILQDTTGDRRLFLRGHPAQGNLADGDEIAFKAKEDGVYKYATLLGGQATLRALKYYGKAE